MHLACPWYIHPAEDPFAWQRLRAGELPLAWAVTNVHNGPGPADDPYYPEALRPGCATTLVGYVTVGYGQRTLPDVLAEVITWRDRYGITDIMLDEVPHEARQANWQVSNIDAMRSAGVDRVFTNPGTVPCLDLLFASDAVCVAEQSWETYRDTPPPQWLAERFAGRTWHLVHSVPADELDQVTALAEQRGAGFLWATDATLPNPWGRLPHGLG